MRSDKARLYLLIYTTYGLFWMMYLAKKTSLLLMKLLKFRV